MTREKCIKAYAAQPLCSRTGTTVTMLSKLKDAKYREEYALYLAEGVKLTEEALSAVPGEIEMLFVSEDGLENDRILSCLAQAYEKNIPIKLATPEVYEKAATEKAPQGILTVLRRKKTADLPASPQARYFLLDTIQDPGNLGTILRSAAAFGADGLILYGCADPTGPKTVRASMGALFRCPIQQTDDLTETIHALQKEGHRVLAAALGENSFTAGKAELRPNDCVIIGNEGHGVSPEVLTACNGVIRIPMQAETESLNASVAASLLLWEYYRTFAIGSPSEMKVRKHL